MGSKKIFYSAFLILNFSFLITAFAQQDAQYSMYMFNQLALNPAYAGCRDALSTTLLYRDQWTGISGAPRTASFAIQTPLKNNKMGLGMEIISDKLGPTSATSVLFSYAYRIRLGGGKLSFGLRTGIYDYAVNWNQLDYKDPNDVYNTKAATSKITGTADFGLYYYSKTFYWGLGMTHLNKGKITDISSYDSSARQAVHFFMPIGKAFEVGNIIINPSILIKGAGNAPNEIDWNLNFLFKERLWLGISLRSRYGIVLLTQYMINEKMRVGYSYDLGLSKIGVAGQGTHEFMIAYDINFHGTKMMMPRFL
ncbi:MAG: type IX secretion system membrane protein PorP/SprF [Bacteroidia bacterium]